jgi:alkanesulfonate monooxygenase SsuD/methylene tetrahydromethanopterin reductase-like flavin-dependent oxidoreductase (luciferase family)
VALRFGVFDQLENPGGTPLHQVYRDRIQLAVRAEEAGFWGWHKSEHHLIPLDAAPSINLFLASVIERTSRIRVCSLVHLFPFYHPLRLLEELCMLDQLSEGRLEIGFGKGISVPEHVLWGLEPAHADPLTTEILDIVLQGMAAEGLFSYEGEFHTFTDVPIEVAPFQAPHPPLWRPGTLETAARLGVRTMAGGPIAMVAAAAGRYRELFDPAGVGAAHEPMIGGVRRIVVAPTDAEADELGRRAWAAFSEHLTRLFRRFGIAPPGDPTMGGDYDLAKSVQAVVVGSPSTVREHVQRFEAEAGTDYFVGCFAWGDLSTTEMMRSFDLFAEHVTSELVA